MLNDTNNRKLALDKGQSFIVQAPAGSGKTELLVQRYLVLLGGSVFEPEEILAVTFTKAAAAQMRYRIIKSLMEATQSEPKEEYAHKTWELANKVLIKDHKFSWELIKNPGRLRIFTIDSLCARLIKQLPILSNFGAAPNVLSDPKVVYKKAVDALFLGLKEDSFWQRSLIVLLEHLDNREDILKELLIEMLKSRDQWLPYVVEIAQTGSLCKLEDMLESFMRQNLNLLLEILGDNLNTLLTLLTFAVANLTNTFNYDDNNQIENVNYSAINFITCDDVVQIKAKLASEELNFNSVNNNVSDVEIKVVLAIIDLLLTKQHAWRKTVNSGLGFLSESSQVTKEDKLKFKLAKEEMCRLLATLSINDRLLELLVQLKLLLQCKYTDKQKQVIEALSTVLPVVVAQLNVIFREDFAVDFIEITQAALGALGSDDMPTDLALALDHQIKHLLVDEFQDTSIVQYRLFSKLVAGWEHNDGRTLFLVGDPQQSIYKFRGAEVGLFLRTVTFGLGAVKLVPLTLSVNFRSTDKIVSWVNMVFSHVFPRYDDIATGAIKYLTSSSINIDNGQGSITSFSALSALNEAKEVVRLAKKSLDENKTVAILVKARKQLSNILDELKQQKIDFCAHEIDPLAKSVTDLLALLRAILHIGDRIAWLAILRAPWCGLELPDLYEVAKNHNNETIYERLLKFETLALSQSAKARLNVVVPILQYWLAFRKRKKLSLWLKGLWLALQGDKLSDENSCNDANRFFQLIDEFSQYQAFDLQLLEDKVSTMYAGNVASNAANLHIMTIHKAKGLEFDTVILPGLESRAVRDDNKLLLWLELPTAKEVEFILAPMHAVLQERDLLYQYIKYEDGKKNRLEQARVLYVAATRAKKNLHLTFVADKDTKPVSGSFLEMIWPIVNKELEGENTENAIDHLHGCNDKLEVNNGSMNIQEEKKYKYSRITYLDLVKAQKAPFYIDLQQYSPLREENIITLEVIEDQNIASYIKIGIVVHLIFKEIVMESLQIYEKKWQQQQLTMLLRYKVLLLHYGVAPLVIDFALSIVKIAIENILCSKCGRWILSQHLGSKAELALINLSPQKREHIIIDRLFVEDNILWIIDYKLTHGVKKPVLADFPEYHTQLQYYAQIMRHSTIKQIKLGLYFPLTDTWLSWDFNG